MRVNLTTVLEDSPPLLYHLILLFILFLLRDETEVLCAQISSWMLAQLAWVEILIRQHQDVRIILFVPSDKLPEVYRACNIHRVLIVDPHPVQVFKPNDSFQWLIALDVAKEAHSLKIPVPQGFVCGNSQLVLPKFVKDRPQQIHAGIFPETSVCVKGLVPEKISHCGKFIERTVPIERAETLEMTIGKREVVFGDILQSPQLHLIAWIHQGCLFEEILLDWRQLPSKPGLVNDGRNDTLPLLLLQRLKGEALVENDHLIKGYPIVDQALKNNMHTFSLYPGKSLLHLIPINLINSISHQSYP